MLMQSYEERVMFWMWKAGAYQQGLPDQEEAHHGKLNTTELCLYLGTSIYKYAKEENEREGATCSHSKPHGNDGQGGEGEVL